MARAACQATRPEQPSGAFIGQFAVTDSASVVGGSSIQPFEVCSMDTMRCNRGSWAPSGCLRLKYIESYEKSSMESRLRPEGPRIRISSELEMKKADY